MVDTHVTSEEVLQLNFWYMSRRRKRSHGSALLLLAMIGLPNADVIAAELGPVASRDGHFLVRLVPAIDPLRINTLHSWTLVVTTADEQPVSGADIRIEGGMPEHDHGLPTAPRVSDADSEGHYIARGMRFHMSGAWVLVIDIDNGKHQDRVVLPLTLEAG